MEGQEKRIGAGRAIHRLDIHIRRFLDTHLNRGLVESVTCGNGRIIGYLKDHEDQEICQRDLENAFGISRATASKALSLMEKKGLITRQSVQRDARLKRLALTDRSRELCGLIDQDHRAMEALLLRGFSPEEQERLFCYLARMRQNLKEEEAK